MDCPFFLVDAFVAGPFTGNPAGVCLLDAQASEDWMQNVAMEINHAETAFVWKDGENFQLKWFTPTVEIDLCGHATLGTTHVLHETGLVRDGESVTYLTRSGPLHCRVDGETVTMDFPTLSVHAVDDQAAVAGTLGLSASWVGSSGMDWFLEVATEGEVRNYVPDLEAVSSLGLRGVCLTAKSSSPEFDFVSRFFAPRSGVDEDHVTGSAHCALAPYWANHFGKQKLTGYQASRRGGLVMMELLDDRVQLSGSAKTVVTGRLTT